MATNNPYYSAPQAQGTGFNVGGYSPNQSVTLQEMPRTEYSKKQQRQANRANRNPWLGEGGRLSEFFGSEGMTKAGNIVAGVGQSVEGVMTGVGAAIDTHHSLNAPIDYFNDMEFASSDVTIDGVPSYAGVSKIGSEVRGIDADAVTRGMGLTGFKGGVSAGAAIGGGIGAGVGLATAGTLSAPLAAIGSGVGALAGGTIGWIKGMTKKGKADKAAYEAYQRGIEKHKVAQNKYNEGVEDYFEGVDTKRATIQGEQNRQSRMFGLNQFRDPFRSIV